MDLSNPASHNIPQICQPDIDVPCANVFANEIIDFVVNFVNVFEFRDTNGKGSCFCKKLTTLIDADLDFETFENGYWYCNYWCIHGVTNKFGESFCIDIC